MRFLDDLKISTKILCALAVVCLAFAASATISGLKFSDLTERYEFLTENSAPSSVEVARATRQVNQIAYAAYRAMAYDGQSREAADAKAAYEDSVAKLRANLANAEKLNPVDAAGVHAFDARIQDVITEGGQAIELGLQNRNDEARSILNGLDPKVASLTADLRAFNEKNVQEDTAEAVQLHNQAHQMILMISMLAIGGIGAGLGFGVWMSKTRISRPLDQLSGQMARLAASDFTVDVQGLDRGDEVGVMAKAVQVFKDNGLRAQALEREADAMRASAEADRERTDEERRRTEAEQAMVVQALASSLERLAKGDLTTRIDTPFQGQYAQIRSDFNAAAASLAEAMEAIVGATDAIRGGSDEIATASDDLSRRTEQQAASLEETAAALDQITATVTRSAEGARQASGAAGAARVEATRSGEIVRDAVQAMGEIESGSRQISQIIGVIDEIAFQTNLLALNAGVEAARAGDAGKGFAVVASEVRALAQRSAEAAKEIKTLISASSRQVERGVKLVGDTGQALEAIVSQVAEIDTLIAEIARSSQEQSTGLSEVNSAVNQMDQVTQQNAAMVEEATAAASGLRSETNALNALVGRFTIQGGAAVARRPAAVATPDHAPRPSPARSAQRRLATALAPQADADGWEEF